MPSAIPYLDETWNPITGCTPISPGCDRCWARAIDTRFRGGAHGPEWHPEILDRPGRWRKPRRVGVCFTGDLYHEQALSGWRIQVYLAMLASPRHTYLLLTKRAQTMRASSDVYYLLGNVWHGVTVEDQPWLEGRLPHLINARVEHRWISAEPLIGPLYFGCALTGVEWLVVGCESGPGARPCPLEWVEGVVEQCQSARVPVYVKQIRIGSRVVHDPAQFPAHLRLRQYPEGWV